jgi:hypothetical protein
MMIGMFDTKAYYFNMVVVAGALNGFVLAMDFINFIGHKYYRWRKILKI